MKRASFCARAFGRVQIGCVCEDCASKSLKFKRADAKTWPTGAGITIRLARKIIRRGCPRYHERRIVPLAPEAQQTPVWRPALATK